MKVQDLVSKIENVYGPYENADVKVLVTAFIVKNWKEEEFVSLFGEILKKHPINYATPDISVFNGIWDESHNSKIEYQADQAWDDMLKIKSDRSLLCTDKALQETLSTMGGVNMFLDRRGNDFNWCRKDFLQIYLSKSRMNLKEIPYKILLSQVQIAYPKQPVERFYQNDILIIGNQEEGAAMIDNMSKTMSIEYRTDGKPAAGLIGYKRTGELEQTGFKTGKELFQIPGVEDGR